MSKNPDFFRDREFGLDLLLERHFFLHRQRTNTPEATAAITSSRISITIPATAPARFLFSPFSLGDTLFELAGEPVSEGSVATVGVCVGEVTSEGTGKVIETDKLVDRLVDGDGAAVVDAGSDGAREAVGIGGNEEAVDIVVVGEETGPAALVVAILRMEEDTVSDCDGVII